MEWKAATPAGTARDSSRRARGKRPPITEYAVKYVFWRRALINKRFFCL